MRDSFTFYRSFMESIDDADPETYKRMMQAITHYAMDGIEPEGLSVLEKGLFISWKANVDASNRRKDNGLKGGRPKKTETENNLGFDDENRNVSRLSDEKPNKKEKENVNEKENETENEKEKAVEPLSFSNENDCRAEAQRVIEEWNTLESIGIAPVNTISRNSKRYVMLCSRIREYGEEKVIDAINRIRGSDFLLGRKTDFTITFDWFVKPNNFVKVADGNYSNNARSGTTAEDNRQAFYDKWRDV